MKKLQVLFFSVSALVFALFISVAEANTKIAPTEAEPGHPFTIIDTPEGRLIDGSVVVFKLDGLEVVLPGRTHKPFNTMQSRLAPDMFNGEYSVFVRQPDGTEFEIGLFPDILDEAKRSGCLQCSGRPPHRLRLHPTSVHRAMPLPLLIHQQEFRMGI